MLLVLEDRDGNAVLLLESGVVLYINSQVLMSTKAREDSSQRGYIDSILFFAIHSLFSLCRALRFYNLAITLSLRLNYSSCVRWSRPSTLKI